MPYKRFRSAAVNVSQHVYLFGGRNLSGSLVRSSDSSTLTKWCCLFRCWWESSGQLHVVLLACSWL